MNGAVWFYIAVTLAAIIWLGWQYVLASASKRWPRVEGPVIRAWVERVDDEYAYYSPRVEYQYTIDGDAHRSSRLWVTGDKSMRRGRAEAIASEYQAGDAVDVWYDPGKPSRATLRPGGAGRWLVMLVVVSVAGPMIAFAFSEQGRRVLRGMGIEVE